MLILTSWNLLLLLMLPKSLSCKKWGWLTSIGRLSVMLARVGSLSMQTLKTTLYRPGLSTQLAKGRRAGSSTISNCGFSTRNLRSPASPLGV